MAELFLYKNGSIAYLSGMVSVSKIFATVALIAAFVPPVAASQTMNPPESAPPSPPYAAYADLVLAAPVIIDATVRSTSRLKPVEAPDLGPGMARLYVEADIGSLVRAGAPLPPRVGYLLDVKLDASGQVPKLRKVRVLLFARPASAAGQIQLVGRDAQRLWSPGADALTRRIVQETLAANAPPAITGVGNAFHVPGALPGEGETQVFLTTAGGQPISLNIARAADGNRSWSVSLSEIVDAAAVPPPHDTLLWYRLACSLPRELPERSLASAEPTDATLAREDYQFVLGSLGPCDREDAL